jgi:hypothetical protein
VEEAFVTYLQSRQRDTVWENDMETEKKSDKEGGNQ